MLVNTLKTTVAVATLAVLAPIGAMAAPVSDVQDYSNNTATEYFVDVDGNKTSSPYYRYGSSDWGWSHGNIAGSSFTSIKLDISAYDIDSAQGEVDRISIFDGVNFVNVFNLTGINNTWTFATVDLTAYSWAAAQVNAGLKVKMDIDANNGSWAVTLGKSVLSVDGGSQTCVPTPGIPCTTNNVPEPGTMALLGLALGGLALAKRRKARG